VGGSDWPLGRKERALERDNRRGIGEVGGEYSVSKAWMLRVVVGEMAFKSI
jgi:hypothetical protein